MLIIIVIGGGDSTGQRFRSLGPSLASRSSTFVRLPTLGDRLARRVVAFSQQLRREELTKVPGVAETVDWAEALVQLGANEAAELDPKTVGATLGLLLKYQDDIERVRSSIDERLVAWRA